MARAATSRLKCNPPIGLMPALQYLLPAQLKVDPAYQRTLDTGPSQTLIRRIAVHWNWDLCQPLVVARRENGDLFVIDGQHRLEAARMRGDIAQLPAVVVQYESAADEAASFVHLNQQRRPLSKLDVFKAAVASEDPQATAILAAIEAAGLTLAPHSNSKAWKPGMIVNIGGIEALWRRHGEKIVREALAIMARSFDGQVLAYAGTLFPGVAAICANEMQGAARDGEELDGWRDMLAEMLGEAGQAEWRADIMRYKADNPNLQFAAAAEAVFGLAWSELLDGFFDDDEVAAS